LELPTAQQSFVDTHVTADRILSWSVETLGDVTADQDVPSQWSMSVWTGTVPWAPTDQQSEVDVQVTP
jgi:hypothetical protein